MAASSYHVYRLKSTLCLAVKRWLVLMLILTNYNSCPTFSRTFTLPKSTRTSHVYPNHSNSLDYPSWLTTFWTIVYLAEHCCPQEATSYPASLSTQRRSLKSSTVLKVHLILYERFTSLSFAHLTREYRAS